MQTPAVAAPPAPRASSPEVPSPETLASFARALNELKQRVKKQIGAEDIRDMRRLGRIALVIEAAGRIMIHFCFEPILFTVGVLVLWVAKQVSVMEIGHTVLHGTYDGMTNAPDLHSNRYWWPAPIHEASWKYAHNVRHHGATNIAGMDPDIHFGTVRLTEQTPYRKHHALQTPTTLLAIFPFFGFWMNAHVTGLLDLYLGNDRADGMDFIPDRTPKTRRMVWKKALSKYIPYYGKELVIFPLLAWTQWWKVLLANCIAETLTALYSAATIYCGHTGKQVASWPEGTRPQSRGQWYAMQVEASQNFQVPRPLSIMCGALDYQIEHHLFPTFPPKRLRQIAPEVRAICMAHGIPYKTDTWPRTMAKVFAHLWQLSRNTSDKSVNAALSSR